jgi:hypothetical protein
MNLFKISELLAAGAVSAIAVASIATIVAGTYRDAGGAMGAERIQQRAALKATPAVQLANVSDGYDRAGGSQRIERVAGVNEIKTYSAGQSKTPLVCKRPGLPLHFGG